MKTPATCQNCTAITKNEKGKYKLTVIPDIKCEVRGTCCDDASTTKKRKENLEKIPEAPQA